MAVSRSALVAISMKFWESKVGDKGHFSLNNSGEFFLIFQFFLAITSDRSKTEWRFEHFELSKMAKIYLSCMSLWQQSTMYYYKGVTRVATFNIKPICKVQKTSTNTIRLP